MKSICYHILQKPINMRYGIKMKTTYHILWWPVKKRYGIKMKSTWYHILSRPVKIWSKEEKHLISHLGKVCQYEIWYKNEKQLSHLVVAQQNEIWHKFEKHLISHFVKACQDTCYKDEKHLISHLVKSVNMIYSINIKSTWYDILQKPVNMRYGVKMKSMWYHILWRPINMKYGIKNKTVYFWFYSSVKESTGIILHKCKINFVLNEISCCIIRCKKKFNSIQFKIFIIHA